MLKLPSSLKREYKHIFKLSSNYSILNKNERQLIHNFIKKFKSYPFLLQKDRNIFINTIYINILISNIIYNYVKKYDLNIENIDDIRILKEKIRNIINDENLYDKMCSSHDYHTLIDKNELRKIYDCLENLES